MEQFPARCRFAGRNARDRLRFKRGTRLIMGNALVARLLHDLRRLTVDIRFETALKDLIKVGDEIVGAILLSPSARLPCARARA